MMEKIYDIAWEIDVAGRLQLEQDAGYGEVVRMELHPLHVRAIAEDLGLLKGDPAALQLNARLASRLRALRDRIETINAMMRSHPVYPPGADDDDPDTIYAEATLELADEFCADLPDMEPPSELAISASSKAGRHMGIGRAERDLFAGEAGAPQ